MSKFDEWFESQKRTLYAEDDKWVAKKGWEARQQEVDELQKRIDEAWNELDDRYSKEYIIERIENILKGNQDAG